MIGWLRHTKDGHDLAKRDYWRDERDRITAWKRGTDAYYNAMEDGRGNRYGYDAEGQLTSASYRAINPETENHQDGTDDLDKLKAAHMNAVLANPGMKGRINDITYSWHQGEPDYVYKP